MSNFRRFYVKWHRLLPGIAALCLFSLTLGAEGGTMQTLTHHGSHANGFYVAPVVKWTRIAHQDGLLMGLRGGWVLGGGLTLGLAGYGWVDEDIWEDHNRRSGLELGYGGLFLEAIIHSDKLVHVAASVTLGAGGYCDNRLFDFEDFWHHGDYVFTVLEPELDVELNVSRILRVGGGVSYRCIGHTQGDPLRASDLNGWAGSLYLKIGRF